ncbi:MAG: MMPL family transporter [Deltaproteobacteria bacterium]|nr:MMPL family transporter [Deltaproteobacteria bacterium]
MADDRDQAFERIERLNQRFAGLAGWCFDHRSIVGLICLLLFAGSIVLASKVQQDASYESYFNEGDDTYEAYQKYLDDFGSDEVSYIGYEIPDLPHGVWNVDAMAALIALTEALEDEVPFVYEVTSLANAELTVGTEEGLEITKIRDEWPLTQEELLERREAYLKKPLLVGGIVNQDASFAAILIEMDRTSTDPPEEIVWDPAPEKAEDLENMYPQVSDTKITEILARPQFAAFRFFPSGDVALNAFFNRVLVSEPAYLMMISLLLISALQLVGFRSFVGVAAPLVVLVLTALTTVAFMVVVGYKMGISFSATPTLLMVIGVAYCVHVLSEFRTQMVALGDRREALVKTMSLVGLPSLLTAVTTAVGFASMAFVPIRTMAEGAVYQAFGVMAAYFFSVTVLLGALSFGARRPKWVERARASASDIGSTSSASFATRALDGIARFNLAHRTGLLFGFAVFTIACLVGSTRVVVDSNWLADFWDDSPIRVNVVKVDDEMGGMSNIIYLFDGGHEESIKEPAVLREIERVQALALEDDWLVRKTYSIVDIVKDLNQSFHSDDPAYHRIPETREEVAQYLLLYESSGGEEAAELVSPDYRVASLELRVRVGRIVHMAALIDRLDAALVEKPLEKTETTLTGIGALWLKLTNYIVSSQVEGFGLALIAVTLVMIVLFRSISIGLIAMIPNVVPVLLALGAMGWFDITLDYNKATIASIALGIAVDDTVHLMSRFRLEFGIHRSYEAALHASMQDVGRALIHTSIALVLGFLVLCLSELRSQAFYGILLAASLTTALLADLFLLPPLVLWLKPFGPEQARRTEAPSAAIREAA